MFKKLAAITVVAVLAFTNQEASAKDVETLDEVISCVQKTPLSSEHDAIYECYDPMFVECLLIDPPGELREGPNSSTGCFYSVADQVKLKMKQHLENEWPDKGTTGYKLKDIAIEYAARRTELNCKFNRALDTVNKYEDDAEDYVIKRRERQFAQCLFGSTIVNYWKIIVHDRLF